MSIRTWLRERSDREFARREREQARTKGYAGAAQGEFDDAWADDFSDPASETLWRIIDRRGVEVQKLRKSNAALLAERDQLCKVYANLSAENARLRVRAAELQEHLSHLLDARDGAR